MMVILLWVRPQPTTSGILRKCKNPDMISISVSIGPKDQNFIVGGGPTCLILVMIPLVIKSRTT